MEEKFKATSALTTAITITGGITMVAEIILSYGQFPTHAVFCHHKHVHDSQKKTISGTALRNDRP
jgi:hypothetical protein